MQKTSLQKARDKYKKNLGSNEEQKVDNLSTFDKLKKDIDTNKDQLEKLQKALEESQQREGILRKELKRVITDLVVANTNNEINIDETSQNIVRIAEQLKFDINVDINSIKSDAIQNTLTTFDYSSFVDTNDVTNLAGEALERGDEF